MDPEKLLNAIEKATNGTYLAPYYTSTLLGWIPEFDEEGRPANCDPNWKTGDIIIAGETYSITKKGWKVTIKKGGNIVAERDLTPDYLRK